MLLPIDPTRHWHRSLCFVFAGIALLGGILVGVLTTPIVAIAGIVISVLFLLASVRADGAYRLYHAYNVISGIYARVDAGRRPAGVLRDRRLGADHGHVARGRAPRFRVDVDTEGLPPARRVREPLRVQQRPGRARLVRAATSRWARHTHNTWALTLLPFLVVLRSAQQTADHSIRGEIYSLY